MSYIAAIDGFKLKNPRSRATPEEKARYIVWRYGSTTCDQRSSGLGPSPTHNRVVRDAFLKGRQKFANIIVIIFKPFEHCTNPRPRALGTPEDGRRRR